MNKFVSIYVAISYFGEKKNDLVNIVSPKNSLSSSVENFLYKVSKKEADIVDKNIHEFAIIATKKSVVWEKRKMKREIVETINDKRTPKLSKFPGSKCDIN